MKTPPVTVIGLHVLVVFLFAAGCASTDSAKIGLNTAIESYETERYEDALEEASEVARRGPTADRVPAAYVAGIAALQLGQLDDASRLLQEAIDRGDAATAARARASLGLVRIRQSRWNEAALLLEAAATEPPKTIGEAPPSRPRTRTPRWETGTRRPERGVADGHRSTTTFTLQLGAFETRTRAENLARSARSGVARAGEGPPRVEMMVDQRLGRLYVVRIGYFATRNEAAGFRNRFGQSAWIVTEAES